MKNPSTLRLGKTETVLIDTEGNSRSVRVSTIDNNGVVLEWETDKEFFPFSELTLQVN